MRSVTPSNVAITLFLGAIHARLKQSHLATAAIAVVAATCAAHAQPTAWTIGEWETQRGTSGSDESFAGMSDGVGGIFCTGLTNGSLGGPHRGGFDVPSGWTDGNGMELTSNQFGTASHESAHAIAPGPLPDDTIIGGGTAGVLGAANAGGFDAFMTNQDSMTGTRRWTIQFGTPGIDDLAALGSDGAGGAFGTGITGGSLAGPNAGGFDGFVIHAGSAGDIIDMWQFGTQLDDEPKAVAFDGTDVILGGSTRGGLQGPNQGGDDAFVMAFDPNTGQQLWVDQFGTAQADTITAMFPDDQGGAFFTGITGGSLAGPNQGGTDIIVGHYDSSGAQTWVKQLGTSANDEAHAIAPDGMGGFVVGGHTRGSFNGPNQGGWDGFIICFDSNGESGLAHQIGTPADDFIHGLAPDGNGATIVTGATWGSLGGPNAGFSDIFTAKFGLACYADCDQSTGIGTLDLFDFLCFQGQFVAESWNACNCDTSTGASVCDLFDFLCFQGAFVSGCL